ncbi:hypothetical protein JTB14_019821 [Gonioctena quinquepunctata]|nr:hypothetical protein JTB14_019821 [Gonioctena quinquepunctata]
MREDILMRELVSHKSTALNSTVRHCAFFAPEEIQKYLCSRNQPASCTMEGERTNLPTTPHIGGNDEILLSRIRSTHWRVEGYGYRDEFSDESFRTRANDSNT